MTKEAIVCYSLREWERQREGASHQPLPPSNSGLPFRPRVLGAIAAGVVALVAAAALLWPSATPAVSSAKAPPPAGAVVEQTSAGLDDGVPSSTDVARGGAAGARHCEHEL